MNFKRITAAALALVMATSTAAFAAEEENEDTNPEVVVDNQVVEDVNHVQGDIMLLSGEGTSIQLPEGWTPADGARLISANPFAGNYETVITINGEALVSYEYTKEIPDSWETETIVKQLSEISAVPTGYVPLRAVAQADDGSADWFKEENESWFYLGGNRIITRFDDMSIEVEGEVVEEAFALLIDGVTYIPVSVIDGLEGFSVTDNSADGVESYEITTPNGAPIIKMAKAIRETANLGMGMQTSMEEIILYYGEEFGFNEEMMTECVAFLPVSINANTLILAKLTDESKQDEIKAAFEGYQQYQYDRCNRGYLEASRPAIQNAQIIFEGDWALFLISNDTEAVQPAVEQFRATVAEMG